MRPCGAIRRLRLHDVWRRRPGDEWRQRIDGETLLTGSIRSRWAERCCLKRGRDACAGQHRNSGRILHRLDDAAELHRGLPGYGAAGNRAVTLQPIVQGTAAGTTFALNPANQYTLRVRVHCPEIERVQAVYHSFGDSGLINAGGESELSLPARSRWRFRSL